MVGMTDLISLNKGRPPKNEKPCPLRKSDPKEWCLRSLRLGGQKSKRLRFNFHNIQQRFCL